MAAALLAREGGKRVLVLERHYRPGGYSHVFTRPGYEWDVGVHYVGRVGEGDVLRALFDRVSAGKLQWAALPEVYDSIEFSGKQYRLHAGRQRFVDELVKQFGGRRDALEAYLRLVSSVVKKSQLDLLNRASGGGARLGALKLKPTVPEWAKDTTKTVLERLGFVGDELAALAGQYGDYGPAPGRSSFAIHAAVVDHYLEGAWYPVGGSSSFANTIAPALAEADGHLALSAEVESILVEGGRAVGVRLVDGSEFRAPCVVSDAGAPNTFQRLLPEAHRPRELLEALASATPSTGYLCLYLGFRSPDDALGLDGTNLWLHRGADFDANIEDFDAPEKPFPVLYLSFPSAKDPSFAQRYPGRATMEVVSMAKWEWFERWRETKWQKRGGEYDALKRSLTERMLAAVFERLPQLRGRVDHAELSTPLSTAHFSGHPRGELYGVEGTPARYRVPLRAQTPVGGLFLTGADLATAGVAGAAFAGAVTAAAILGPRKLFNWVPLEAAFGRMFV